MLKNGQSGGLLISIHLLLAGILLGMGAVVRLLTLIQQQTVHSQLNAAAGGENQIPVADGGPLLLEGLAVFRA